MTKNMEGSENIFDSPQTNLTTDRNLRDIQSYMQQKSQQASGFPIAG